MEKGFSLLCGILIFTIFLCSCEFETKNKITKLEFAENYSNIELTVDDTSDELLLSIFADGNFDQSTLLANSDNSAVAAVVDKTYNNDNTLSFKIEATKKGIAHIWFETADKSVKTQEIKVTVKDAEIPITEPVTEDAVPTDKTEQTQTERETSQTRSTVYVTPTGKKYHYSKSCAGKNATPISLENAKRQYDPCKKCAHG